MCAVNSTTWKQETCDSLGEFRFGRVGHPIPKSGRGSSEIRKVLPEVGNMFIQYRISDVRDPISDVLELISDVLDPILDVLDLIIGEFRSGQIRLPDPKKPGITRTIPESFRISGCSSSQSRGIFPRS
jgi:hypothetical protein